ncbi:aspartate aminotransferase family protein [Pyrofollis japonicus]|uniref:aspartate aminotransferase family protein n=1 Tax=Pyrofollis japonicus TaxID=3060460 RepID=UPI00295AA09B|nr:aspartate aminotransferase family protein [Pyrofollis japonicus]BEP17442.1 aspartate aminotransferase family protein [Pyrofollis japonicus]
MVLELFRYYGSRGLRIARASMQYVWDTNGTRYLDAHTGHGVAFLGHNNPRIVSRLRRQLNELTICSPSFECSVQQEAVEKLSRVAPPGADTVLFANSGAEAVETALKIAWAYTGRRKVVAFKGSFHGRTLGALSVTWSPSYRKGFPVLEDVEFIPYNAEPYVVEKAVDENTAAIIVEPVLGEGGVVLAEKGFLEAVKKVARENGAVLIVDEVQTGFGRTGRTWCLEHYGIRPDIVTAGKALGGGFPVSAVFTRRELAESLRGGRHGSTYAGNPLALAAVSAAVDVLLEEGVAVRAAEAGKALLDALVDRVGGNRLVRDIRGKGLMIGVELRKQPLPVLKCMQDRFHVLALRAGITVVRLLPPYSIGLGDVEAIVGAIRGCLEG